MAKKSLNFCGLVSLFALSSPLIGWHFPGEEGHHRAIYWGLSTTSTPTTVDYNYNKEHTHLLERQGVADVLEEHRAGGADLAHELVVVGLHVDVVVRLVVVRTERVKVRLGEITPVLV